MRTRRKNSLVVTLLLFFGLHVNAQVVTVPPEAKSRTAPFVFTPDRIKNGEQIYTLNCKSCHGDPGKGNFAKLNPIPKDPASAEYQKNTDGEIFYILSNGRGLMPNFVNTLNEEQRWEVISFVRSFNKNYKQPPITKESETVAFETGKLNLSIDSNRKQILGIVTDSTKGTRKPVQDISIKLFVKRTFGNLKVAESKTDKDGCAYFTIPNDLPGDSLGMLYFIGIAESKGKEIRNEIVEKLGLVTKPKQLLDQRTWWNVNKMAPIWLIILYTSGVFAVYGTVLYVLLQLRKLSKSKNK